ncbi:hypothetical protein [Coprobacillus sp. AF33-1AC]|uniref:hypothetical protein n=1 Tax=Coprobacillus sp. AF33-1AC TaxID=2292032 RepID=UPI000E503B79|nr:hypothetical protein [Coprobacillus sp. AF33-1AC]RHM59660.1 hypothetical protein DWZ53_08940 [Coprobacillus sp. AF33-1AC]
MGEFKPITTQEEFEKRLTERLEQKERSVTKKYEGYTSPEDLEKLKKGYESQIITLNGQLENAQSDVSKKYEGFLSPEQVETLKKDYDTKIANYETDSVKTRVAIEMKLPLELKDRLRGSTEEEIREDAKTLASLTGMSYQAPHYLNEPTPIKGDENDVVSDEHYKKLIPDMED